MSTLFDAIKNTLKSEKINYFWIASFAFVFLRVFFVEPLMSYNSQLLEEVGNVYLGRLIENGWSLKFFLEREAGYLNILPRALSYIAFHFFPLSSFAYILNITSLVLASFFLTFICSRENRVLVKSDLLRFVFVLVVSMFQMLYLHWISPVMYFAIIMVSLLLFQNKEKFSNSRYYFFLAFAVLVAISKIAMLMLIPFIVIAIIYHLKHKQLKSAYFWFAPLILMLLNLIDIITHTLRGRQTFSNIVSSNIKNLDINSIFEIYFIFPLKTYLSLLTANNRADGVAMSIGFVIIAFVLFKIYETCKGNLKTLVSSKVNLFIIFAFLFALMCTFLAYLGLWSLPKVPITYAYWSIYHAKIIFFFAILVFIYNFIPKKIYRNSLILLLFVIFIVQTFNNSKVHKFKNHILYDEKIYDLILRDDFFVPRFITGWSIMIKNNGILYSKIEDAKRARFQKLEDVFNEKVKIRAIVVNNPENEYIKAVAYNKENNVIGEAIPYSQTTKRNKLLVFDGERVSPSYIKFFDEQGDEIQAEIAMVGGLEK